MMRKPIIAFHIQTEVQFFAIEPVMRELKNYPYKTVILIEKHKDDLEGHREKAQATKKLMNEYGYKVEYTEDNTDIIFDLCLTPYLSGMIDLIKSNCYLKYEYGSLNTKPSLTYIPLVLRGFHGFLCNSSDGVNLLSVYGRTFPVDNLRFLGKKKQVNHSKKKVVLFAPTYNDEYDAKENAEIIEKLKTKYHVIVKAHHGINYLKVNTEKKEQIQKGPDEYYGSEVSIVDLLMRADVCLANNSSVIGDAMRAGVPCAVYTHDIDMFRWNDLHTTQYTLYKEGKLLVCKTPKTIVETIDKALSKEYKENWKLLEERFFPKEYRTGVKGYIDVINYYLFDTDAKKSVLLHDYNTSEYVDAVNKRDSDIRILLRDNDMMREALDDFGKRKLYKLADKFYKLEGRLINARKGRKK